MAATHRSLTRDELAREADVPPEHVDELVAANILRPDSDDRFEATDVSRVRLARALRGGGISADDIRWATDTNQLPIGRVAEMFAPPSHSDHTFGEFIASLGDRGADLPSIYSAFGLAVPPLDLPVPADEERLIRRFIDLWAMVDDVPGLSLRAAHITGDGMRRITGATLDLFDAHGGSPPDWLRRGLSQDESMVPSVVLAALQADLLVWLDDRHTEHEVFERIVGYMERTVAAAGRTEPRAAHPPAIAFVDLAGYTELTAIGGDERAADFATNLHVVASRVLSSHGGRVVKQLGDGVLCRFGSAIEAVAGVRELMTAIAQAGLPAAHAAIAIGPFVVREGDVYGNTVNLASRIAALAQPGEVLIPVDDARAVLAPTEWTDAGEATFKGFADPIGLARLRVPSS